jgi:hypothetical protein
LQPCIADACCGTPNATFVFIEPLFLSLDARPLSHSHCNRLSCPIIFSTSRQKNPEEKTPAMEKNDMPIVGASDVAAGTSGAGTSAASASAAGASAAAPVQDPVAASNIAAGASAAGASAAAAVQAPVAASDVAAGASAAGASAAAPVQAPVQFPVDWDPYEQEPYVTSENPYDTSIVDDEEVTLCSLVLIPFQSFLC